MNAPFENKQNGKAVTATVDKAESVKQSSHESRMTPGERNRIMIEQMRRLGIARSNAAYYVAEFAQKMTDGSVLTGNSLRVLNAFLNEDFDTKKDINTQSVMSHRTARCKSLIGDIAAMVSKKNFVPLVQSVMLTAIDPTEVERAVKSIGYGRS